MKEYNLTEKRLMKKLGISDWRHLSKDRMMTFASSIKYVNPETAKEILNQIPNFNEYSLSLLNEYSKNIESILEKNEKTNLELLSACKSLISSIESLITSKDIDSTERDELIDKELKVIELMRLIDSDNKKYHLILSGMLGLTSIFSVGILGSILGSNINFFNNSSEPEDDEYIELYDDID